MKIRIAVMALSLLVTHSFASDLDITDRDQTDPLLEIRKSGNEHSLIPADSNLFKNIDPTDAEINKDRTPWCYKKLWGKKDVLLIHPVNAEKHGFINFSKITEGHAGTLKLYIKNHRQGDHDIKIRLGNEVVESESIHKGRWEFFKIKFDHQPVVLEVHASGWKNEFSFVTYKIDK